MFDLGAQSEVEHFTVPGGDRGGKRVVKQGSVEENISTGAMVAHCRKAIT